MKFLKILFYTFVTLLAIIILPLAMAFGPILIGGFVAMMFVGFLISIPVLSYKPSMESCG